MAALKIRALERLAEIIEREVPGLRGKVCAGPADRSHQRSFPNLAIVPERFTFEPWPPDAVDPVTGMVREPTPNMTIAQVGEWSGTIRLELGAATAQDRYRLEELVERVFIGGATGADPLRGDPGADLRSGVLLVDVADCYDARIAFVLDEGQWDNEKVFAQEWFSILRLTVELPALVPRHAVAWTELRVALTESLETVATGNPPPTDTETVRLELDGTYTTI